MNKNGKKDFAYHLSRFLSVYLPGQRNVSENTALSYKDTFKLILLFAKDEKQLLSNQLSISDLTRLFFEEFIQWLKSCRKCGISTCNQRLGAIHAFLSTSNTRCRKLRHSVRKCWQLGRQKHLKGSLII